MSACFDIPLKLTILKAVEKQYFVTKSYSFVFRES